MTRSQDRVTTPVAVRLPAVAFSTPHPLASRRATNQVATRFRRQHAHCEKPAAMPRFARLLLSTLLILAGAVIVATLAMHQAQRHSVEDDASRAQVQLSLYANTLQTLIERYRALPAVLALDPQLREALNGPVSAQTTQALNLKLERINGAAQSSTLELLDRNGLAIGASNWRLPSSYVGHNYGFCPLFP